MAEAEGRRCRGAFRRARRLLMLRKARMEREGQSLRGGDNVSRGGRGMGSRKWSRVEKTGFYGRRMYVVLVKYVAFSSSLISLQIPAVPETRKGRRASRLKIHWSQKKSSILECCPFRLVLYFTLGTQKISPSIVVQRRALSLMPQHLLRHV